MIDEHRLRISVCGKCTKPLIIENGEARDLTEVESYFLEEDDVLISALGTQAAFNPPHWRCEGCDD